MKIGKKVARLRRLTVAELRREYERVTGEETRARHKDYLVRRIAWRLQAKVEGGLSERARRRAAQRARDVARFHGTPLVVMQNGKVVEIPPDKIKDLPKKLLKIAYGKSGRKKQ